MTDEASKTQKPIEVLKALKTALGMVMSALDLAIAEAEMDELKTEDRASARELADAMKEARKVPGQERD